VQTPFTQWHEILSQNTRDSKVSYGGKPKSLSHLVSKRYQVVTDGQMERQTELEIWGKAQRESAWRPKSDWGKLGMGG